ncbi:ATP-binding protein [Thermodesulfobacteriota bacterium]
MSKFYSYFPKRIFLFGLFLFILVTALLVFGILYNIKNELILESELHAGVVARHLSYELFDVYDMQLDELMSEADEEFNNHFLSEVKPLGVDSIKIFDKNSYIVFSNDPTLVGAPSKDNQNVRRALDGEIISNIASAEYYKKVYNVEIDKDQIETYLPIYDPSGGGVIGVFEIYQDYAPLALQINNAMKRTTIIIVGLMLCFSAVLFLLMRRSNIMITGEKERHVKELESTVEKRTKELSESEKKYRTFLNNVTDSVAVVDRKGKFVQVNNKVLDVTGYSEEEIYSGNFVDIMEQTPDNISEAKKNFLSALKGKNVLFELSVKRKDGRTIPLEILAKNIKYDGKNMVMGAGRDISERKEVEMIRRDFYSMLSHDFRSPLSPILGFSTILLEDSNEELSDRAREMIRSIRRNASKLNSLIDDFLLSSKIDSGKLSLVKYNFNLHSFVDEILCNYEAEMIFKRIKLLKIYSPEDILLSGDMPQLERVFSNLLSNALKYNKDGGVIKVKTAIVNNFNGGRGARIEIYNSFGMINTEDLPRMFEKYKRAEHVNNTSGTGLGLYIVKSILDLHGGEIAASSRAGTGTTFTITLPMESEAASLEDVS